MARIDGCTCVCTEGFSGENCAANIDDCASAPCQNGAQCVDGLETYQCNCVSGWQGTRCELQVDNCEESSGTMQASLTLASGASPTDDEYNGMLIATGGDVVATGVITDYDGTAKTFTATWSACTETGAVCDDTDGVTPTMTTSTTYTLTDDCDPNHATCTRTGAGTHSCACHAGYETSDGGKTCTNIDDCPTGAGGCENGASCVDGLLSFSCVCTNGWAGTLCNVDVDECASYPCAAGHEGAATCVDGMYSYTCVCEDGWSGEHCKVDDNECSSTPCANSGACEESSTHENTESCAATAATACAAATAATAGGAA